MVKQKQHWSQNLSRLSTNSGAPWEKVKEMVISIDIVAMDPYDGWRAFMESTYDAAAKTLGFVWCKQETGLMKMMQR